ncbi:UNVERIFIED_CONTAM: hypothetical protein Sradi_3214000 [Sesamum radiatum]|uniref:Retrotransposon Copia-like N-terminal domain-containing protein n=1 Tax=Sesamum radiatum TaxID=300843 RepID=A0AAW2RFT2_SESRA
MASSSNMIPEAVARDARSGNDASHNRIQLLENTSMIMISAPLNGNNWLTWSRSVRIALEGRDKLGYIDGSITKPTEGSMDYKQWRIVDSIVRTWILGTISKDIVNAFLYSPSARSLWVELEARYGECDGPLVYRIKREISSISQGNLSVSAYFTNLKQLWDEILCLKPPTMCTCGLCICGSNKGKAEEIEEDQLIQFLMGLNEPYDHIRSQILVLDPLPTVNKAYSMVLRVERQRQVNLEYAETLDNSAMNDTCFKLHGIPDWYKDLTDQRRKPTVGRAYAASELQTPVDKSTAAGSNLVSDLIEALKIVQNRMPLDPVHVNFAHIDEMAGPED